MMGRPTKYDPKFIDMVDKYLATTGGANQHLPKLESFADMIDVSVDSLSRWAKEYPDFCGALEKITRRQKEQLIDDGIYGGKEVNATIVKLLLQNNHGMRDKVEQENTGEVTLALTYGSKSKRTNEPAAQAGGSDRSTTES